MRKFWLNLVKIIGIVGISILILFAIIGGYLSGAMIQVASEAPEVDPDMILSSLSQDSKILDKEDQLIEKVPSSQHREIVYYNDIPKDLINAFVSAEDKRFWDHDGVDLLSIMSTIKDHLVNHNMRGASTITMQLARNMYLSYDVSWTRKIQEIFLAKEIESQLTKKEIMESYLNRIFFGQNAYGVQAAAQTYFSKDVSDLTLPECAAIASIVPAPSQYALYMTVPPANVTDQTVLGETMVENKKFACVYNAPAYKRAKWVLGQMYDQGKISKEEYDKAVAVDVSKSIKPIPKLFENVSTYITDLVQAQTVQILMDEKGLSEKEASNLYYNGGLTIHSSLDMDLQTKLQDQFSNLNKVLNPGAGPNQGPFSLNLKYDNEGNIVNDNDDLQYYKQAKIMTGDNEFFIPQGHYKLAKDGSLTISADRIQAYDGYLDLADYYSLDEKGVLKTHQVGSISIDQDMVTKNGDGSFTILPEFFNNEENPKEDFYRINDSGDLVLSKDYYHVDDRGISQPESAVTVLDTKTGEIVAMVGGREHDSQHSMNRALKFPRQPGSAIKPLVDYTAPFALGYNQGACIDDAPIKMEDGKPWPSNFDNKYRGFVSIRQALYESLNPPAVRWLNRVGMDTAKLYLTRYGIINPDHPERDHFVEKSEDPANNDEVLPLAIGGMSKGLTSLEMAGAYQAIGNNGERIPATSIRKIENSQGKILYENKHEGVEVLPPQLNYQLLDCLIHFAEDSYITPSIQVQGIQQGAKTGTTDNKRDFWTCTVSPYYTTAVWLGADNANLTLTGSSSEAAKIAGAVSWIAHKGKKDAKFPVPDGCYQKEVCLLSGQKPTNACRQDHRNMVKKIWVSKETEPKKNCTVHVYRKVDVRNNLLAPSNFPAELTVQRWFIDGPDDYKPGKFNGILPADWSFRIPTAYSTLSPIVEEEEEDPEDDEEKDKDEDLGPSEDAEIEKIEKREIDENTTEIKTYYDDGTVVTEIETNDDEDEDSDQEDKKDSEKEEGDSKG